MKEEKNSNANVKSVEKIFSRIIVIRSIAPRAVVVQKLSKMSM